MNLSLSKQMTPIMLAIICLTTACSNCNSIVGYYGVVYSDVWKGGQSNTNQVEILSDSSAIVSWFIYDDYYSVSLCKLKAISEDTFCMKPWTGIQGLSVTNIPLSIQYSWMSSINEDSTFVVFKDLSKYYSWGYENCEGKHALTRTDTVKLSKKKQVMCLYGVWKIDSIAPVNDTIRFSPIVIHSDNNYANFYTVSMNPIFNLMAFYRSIPADTIVFESKNKIKTLNSNHHMKKKRHKIIDIDVICAKYYSN